MKKFLFVVAALATSMAASAQLWVSGGLSLTNGSNWNVEKSRTNWGINHSIGYALDDALEVGLDFGIGGWSQDEASNFKFNVAPFVRYTFLSEGDFSMFVQGAVNYTYSKDKDADKADWTFGVNVRPGVKYAFTDNFAMVAKFGSLYFSHNHPDGPSTGKSQNSFGLNIDTNLEFALVYSF